MLDDDLGRRLKDAALTPPDVLDMKRVRRRARALEWIRVGMALGVVVVLIAVGAGVVTRWPDAQKSRLAFGPARHTPNILPRNWTLAASPGLKPRLSRQQAATIATGGSSSARAKVVRVAFGLFTDHAAHHVGSGKLDYHNIPAWVVTLKGVPVCFYGPQSEPCKVGASFIVIRDRDGKRLMESQVVSPPGADQSLAGATLGVYSPGKTLNQAALSGTLVLKGGCVMVKPRGNVQPVMIAWVPGFHTEAGTGGVRVADEQGATVALIGDKVQLGGGPISPSDVRTASGNALPQSCATDHLFAMYTIRRLNQAESRLVKLQQTPELHAAVSRLERRLGLPILLPTKLPQGSLLDSRKGVSFFRYGNHWSGRLSFVFGSRKHVLIDYGVALFDGCGGDTAEPISVNGKPGLILPSRSATWTQLIWPATVKHPRGLYGVTGSLTRAQAIAIAESMSAVTNPTTTAPVGC
jgi:hypothetical protein